MALRTDACTVLVNDRAGPFHPTASREEMQRVVDELGIAARVVATASPEEMMARVRELVSEGATRIAVAGGDGTIAKAVQGLVHTDTALGIIPQGTANNFATALRLPLDLPSALRVLQDGEVREVDLGQIGDRYYTETAGVGLFAEILSVYGPSSNKNLFRSLYALLRVGLSLRAHRVRVTVDGTRIQEPSVMCEVANTFRMAQALPVAPGAKLTDGKLDVVLLGDLTRRELLPYYRAMRDQTHRNLPKVQSFQATEVTIESRRPMPVHADDHLAGTTPVTIRCAHHALKVLVERL